MICRATAPVRLDLAGAWTDVAPFVDRHRGVVINAAIDLRTSARVVPGGDGFRLRSSDLGIAIAVDGADALQPNGELDLIKAALRASDIGPCEVVTHAEASPGSGLGGSGALGVALVAALDVATGVTRTPAATAEAAWRVETLGASIAGGRQDQYAAAIGGFQRLECSGESVASSPIPIDPEFADALARHLVLCHTGTSRFSGSTITRVMEAFRRGDMEVTRALHNLVDIADRMVTALGTGELRAVGSLLRENWRQQIRLDSAMCTPEMAVLEDAMNTVGSFGGKAAGAGAGGSMFFVVPDPASAISRARELGAAVLPVRWSWDGVRTGSSPA